MATVLPMQRAVAGPLVVATLAFLTGCEAAADRPGGTAPAPQGSMKAALSDPVEDALYPDVGDPGVDALHYGLDLTWDPDARLLTGRERLTFRSTEDDDEFQLDLEPSLSVSEVRVDGEVAEHEQDGKDLVVTVDVERDARYEVQVDYSGSPVPVPAPTTRQDLAEVGWTTMADGETWTMQEPFGAYTWYAVNDHPSDKALYDFTLRVPGPMVGVANGELTSRTNRGEQEVTRWHLAEPASSYLVTVAFGIFRTQEATAASGVPITVWVPPEEIGGLEKLTDDAVRAVDWVEERLGPYPFDTLGFLFVDATSGMETQTMITLGIHPYAMSAPVLVHEVVHHWWGDQVTPRDWRDLWMSEGMAMYLQAVYESENGGQALAARISEWSAGGSAMRAEVGPPRDYDPDAFAERNVYFLPGVMWHDVRQRLGDAEFFRLARWWPASHDNDNAGYDDITAWWSRHSGVDLGPVFRRHLLGEKQPRTP
ncbi:M1 family metallopeptidase [Nocardioides sp.]|uniref:M1 family metallopeptidase n=1 Tax=Nocardioides sp. TaxID=35761 RepID=UPI002ED097DC